MFLLRVIDLRVQLSIDCCRFYRRDIALLPTPRGRGESRPRRPLQSGRRASQCSPDVKALAAHGGAARLTGSTAARYLDGRRHSSHSWSAARSGCSRTRCFSKCLEGNAVGVDAATALGPWKPCPRVPVPCREALVADSASTIYPDTGRQMVWAHTPTSFDSFHSP